MALKHFASKVEENNANVVAKNAINNAVISAASANAPSAPKKQNPTALKPEVSKQSSLQPLTQPRTQQSAQPLAQPKQSAEEIATVQNIAETQTPAKREIPLSWSDQQMMCALSAMQIRYGRPAEAIPYLMMIRKINPKNLEATRLLALSFMRLQRWNEADAMVEELDYLQKSSSTGVADGLILLYRSLVSFKSNRVADAKSWFGKFRQFNKVS